MMDHIEKFSISSGCVIIETGCARIKDNWRGDGQSTRLWNWAINAKTNIEAVSIDITPEFVKMSEELSPRVNHICGDSLQVLVKDLLIVEALPICGLLYLDSFDWNEEIALESATHHLCELLLVYRDLPSGCMIVVDDRHGTTKGKHTMVQHFFEKMGIEPVFCEYQIGWIKP